MCFFVVSSPGTIRACEYEDRFDSGGLGEMVFDSAVA